MKASECCSCCWLLHSGGEKAKPEKLSDYVLLTLAATKIELDIMYSIGVDDGEPAAG